MTVGAVLHAVRHPGGPSAAQALAWFAATPGSADREVIGYLLAADQAEWFRWEDGVPRGPDGLRDLDGAFELFATSGASQLRWVHEADGAGWAVSLAEDPAALPAGQPPPHAPGLGARERRRLAGTATRMLAGHVIAGKDGWATLATARYPRCDVPVTAQRDQEVWAELAEYVITDEHGNLSVADTLLLSLAARAAESSGKEAQP
jgi:hypothetical protein